MGIAGGIIAGLWTGACMVFQWWLCQRKIKRLEAERGDLLLRASSLRECRNKWQAAHDSILLQWREADSGMQQQLGERDARARFQANAVGQQHGVDWARGIAARALSPKHYWRLEAAIEREVARAEDKADNPDVAAVLKRHRREALKHEGNE